MKTARARLTFNLFVDTNGYFNCSGREVVDGNRDSYGTGREIFSDSFGSGHEFVDEKNNIFIDEHRASTIAFYSFCR